MNPITAFTPAQVENPHDPAPISGFTLQLLAQGDSWFSTGAVPPVLTTNLFDGMGMTNFSPCVINCAHPGSELALMTSTTRERVFLSYLNGIKARRWAGLLLSGGGNDLIAAAHQPSTNAPELRLFATKAEWEPSPGAERYLSNAGWRTFATHIRDVFRIMLAERDKGINRGIPVVMHSYDIVVPHDVGAGFNRGPWLYPAVKNYGIPEADWPALGAKLLWRLQTLLDHLAATTPDGTVHVVHSQGALTPAATTEQGATEDWVNEIHPTPHGYRKLSAHWLPVLDAVFGGTVRAKAVGIPTEPGEN